MVGFVYIMSNPSFVQGRVKIGKSDRDPERHRKDELHTTGVPEPFHVEYYAFVEDHDETERVLHAIFSAKRVNKTREFFDVPINWIVLEIHRKTKVLHEKRNYKNQNEAVKYAEEKQIYEQMISIGEQCRRFINTMPNSQKLSAEILAWELTGNEPSNGVRRVKILEKMAYLSFLQVYSESTRQAEIIFNDLIDLLCINLKKSGLSSFSGAIMRYFLKSNLTEKAKVNFTKLQQSTKFQSTFTAPSFSTGSWLLNKFQDDWFVAWEQKTAPGSWVTGLGQHFCRDYKKYYNFDYITREFSLVIDDNVVRRLIIPSYIDFDAGRLYFNPGDNFFIRLRCLSEITGLVQISQRYSSIESKKMAERNNVIWENLPDCTIKKTSLRETEQYFYKNQEIPEKWMREICRGQRESPSLHVREWTEIVNTEAEFLKNTG